jgi:hypothetical protein
MSLEEEKKVQARIVGDDASAGENFNDLVPGNIAAPNTVDGDVPGHKGKEKQGNDPGGLVDKPINSFQVTVLTAVKHNICHREEDNKLGLAARVVLPLAGTREDDVPGGDTDEDDGDDEKGEDEQEDDGDFLSDFPDDTPVCAFGCQVLWLLSILTGMTFVWPTT